MTIKDSKNFGNQAEQQAVDFLIDHGYKIIFRNWHCRFGEIDIITIKNNITHFVEVKARRSNVFGYPEEALTKIKIRRLLMSINSYWFGKREGRWQLDLITIEWCDGKYFLDFFENVG